MVQRDWLSAMLNDLMNCKRAGKSETSALHVSKLMLGVLEIMKRHGYIADFRLEQEKWPRVIIKIGKLTKCGSIRPRFFVTLKELKRYERRFLPGRGIGILIISTSKGLMSHNEALEQGIGGSLIAYCY